MFAGLFGVLGAYLRFRLSVLNAVDPQFPYGTFAANTLGTWLIATVTVASTLSLHTSAHPGDL